MQQRVVWSSWAEWRALYADLFALDDDVRRRAGVQRVATFLDFEHTLRMVTTQLTNHLCYLSLRTGLRISR